MTHDGLIWRLQRGTERYEARVNRRNESGDCELGFFWNGTLLRRIWMAAGRGLGAVEEALARREALRASGWRECPDR
jgi:hypothetical protein